MTSEPIPLFSSVLGLSRPAMGTQLREVSDALSSSPPWWSPLMAATSLDVRNWDFIWASINFPLCQPLNGEVRWAFPSSSNLHSDLQWIMHSISRKTKTFYNLWPEEHSSGALSVQRIPSVCPHAEYTAGLVSSKWVELAAHAFFANP